MSLASSLVGFGLRQVIGEGIGNVVEVVERRFRDHSQKLPVALGRAHDRAWQALGVALAAGFQRYADLQGLVEGARQAVNKVADALREGYPNLSRLLRTPTPSGPPLLVTAFSFFFRREVETDDELAHGLFFDGLRQLTA